MATTNGNAVERAIPSVVDWLVGALLVVVGLLAAAGGFVLADAVDRGWAEWAVSQSTMRGTLLTEAERVEAVYSLALWGGRGLVVTGLLVAVIGIGFLVHRRRVRATEAGRPDAISTAVLGAVVTAVTMMVPLSPLLGGGVAGYFGGVNRRSGATHGAYAGLLTAVPIAVLLGFLVWGTVAAGTPVVGLIMLGATAFSVLYAIGLSAAGGYLGVALGES